MSCGGEGCEACSHTGKQELTQCPKQTITPKVAELYRFAELAIDGHWPVSGGTLEQTPAFLSAVRRVKSDRNAYRLPKPNG